MARFWKEKEKKKGRKRQADHRDTIVQGFYEDPDNFSPLQGRKTEARDSNASLGNSLREPQEPALVYRAARNI